MQLRTVDIVELTAVLPLAIDVEPYRERLGPVAVAVLQGESRRAIEKQRDAALRDVWDEPLREATLAGLAALRRELDRKAALLELARADLEKPVQASRIVRHVVDRVLAELLDGTDKNIAALEELERQLEGCPTDERSELAAVAARGAYVAVQIPPNELRAAIVRTGRAIEALGVSEDEAFDRGIRLMAQALATEERRAAVREWSSLLGEGSAEHAPLLAEELRALAAESAVSDAGSDVLWIQACLGLTWEMGMGMS